MDLDPVNFTDEVFPSYASIKPQIAQDEANQGSGKQKQRNQEIMTDELYYMEQETNTKFKKNAVSIQTDKLVSTGVGGGPDDEEDEYQDDDEKAERQLKQAQPVPEYDEKALAKWLNSIYPKLSQLLESNLNNKTFNNYEVFWDEERGEIELWQKLQTSFDFKEANKATQNAINQVKAITNDSSNNDNEDDWESGTGGSQQTKLSQNASSDHYQVVSVAWSCNGATLAVAYGKTNHSSWCEHKSALSTWGIFRREFDAKKPTKTIDVENCLTTIEFHPSDPLILAGGTMNGEIYLWNIDQDESYISHSAIDEYYHREAITKLTWIKYESLTSLAVTYCIMSVSTDAKILVWKLSDKLRFPAKGHLLARKKDGEMSTVGGTSFARVGYGAGGQDDSTFIVGTEGGSIFKCNIQQPIDKDISHFFDQAAGGVRWKQEAINLLSNLPNKAIMEVKKRVERYVLDKGEKDIWAHTVYHAKPDIKQIFTVPFNANYERHLGPVTSISPSPFVKRLFLTCSQDGQVRLYDTLSNRPVTVFEPGGYGVGEYLQAVEWSPFRPAVFAVVGSSGKVYIYDLLAHRMAPSFVLTHNDDSVSHSLRVAQAISFNPRQRDFLAVGYHDGFARIYRLNYQLANVQKNEGKILQSFLEEKGTE